jgi:2-aminoadipate transaminase
VPVEHDGMDVDYLERLLEREQPRLIITIPTLHNPTGATMSEAKRLRLLELAQRHNVPIIEDYWCMMLGYEGKREPSLKTLDAGSHVIQLGSFSKAFLPGTRVAWAVLPGDISSSLVRAKRALDRSDSFFLQTLVYEFIRKGFMDLHCRKVDRIYRARLDLVDELMRQHFPSEVSWKKPAGGFCLWATLPPHLGSSELLKRSIAQGVEFNTGNYFYVDRRESNNLRLAFSTLTQPQIRQGIKRLGQVITEFIDQEGGARRSQPGAAPGDQPTARDAS